MLDTDFASVVWHGRDQARVDRILAAYDAHVAHPGLPRRLVRAKRLIIDRFEAMSDQDGILRWT